MKKAAKKTSKIFSALQRNQKPGSSYFLRETLPYVSIAPECIQTLAGPKNFRETLLRLIAHAKHRIIITALYLQDDQAGREILTALHEAKKAWPKLDIVVFVDWHRAQRALIGKEKSTGNASMYQEMAKAHASGVRIYGVPVQRREFIGVMHLKGFIIDDDVLYSGASLNDVYLQKFDRYRIDRYHLIHSEKLASCMASWLFSTLFDSSAVLPLDVDDIPKTQTIINDIRILRQGLNRSCYQTSEEKNLPIKPGEIGVAPIVGLGNRGNLLNKTILELLQYAEKQIILFTPYFNLPRPVRKIINAKLKSGCRVTIVLGDKKANDFYIPPEEPFKTIGALPYIYEVNLRRFCKTRQKAIDAGLLKVHLWHHKDNTYHLKGLLIDNDYALLTGNNMNPRAWRLDLENGLVLYDPHKKLASQHKAELERILEHTQQITHYKQLEDVSCYPLKVQRLIKRLSRVRADRLINQLL